jgi:hypothetical protein
LLPPPPAPPLPADALDVRDTLEARPGEGETLDVRDTLEARPGEGEALDVNDTLEARPGEGEALDVNDTHEARPGEGEAGRWGYCDGDWSLGVPPPVFRARVGDGSLWIKEAFRAGALPPGIGSPAPRSSPLPPGIVPPGPPPVACRARQAMQAPLPPGSENSASSTSWILEVERP